MRIEKLREELNLYDREHFIQNSPSGTVSPIKELNIYLESLEGAFVDFDVEYHQGLGIVFRPKDLIKKV